MILFGAGMSDGNQHSPHNLPLVLAGRGGGTLSPGRHIRHESDHPMANLHVSLMKRMGASPAAWADSTGELVGLSDPSFGGVEAPRRPEVRFATTLSPTAFLIGSR